MFFHFSSFPVNSPEKLSNIDFHLGNNSNDEIADLANLYSVKLKSYNYITENKVYSWDYMSDGRYISPTLRRAYASRLNYFESTYDPFDSNGPVAKFARRNNLFQKGNMRYKVEGYASLNENGRKLEYIFMILRLLIRVIGPNKFMNISRLFVYLSSYHRIKKMWK